MRPPKDDDEKGGNATDGEYQGQSCSKQQHQTTKKDNREPFRA
jgi:hypothetical protein